MRIAGAFIVWTAFIFICGAAVYAGSEKDAITPGTEEQRGFICAPPGTIGHLAASRLAQ